MLRPQSLSKQRGDLVIFGSLNAAPYFGQACQVVRAAAIDLLRIKEKDLQLALLSVPNRLFGLPLTFYLQESLTIFTAVTVKLPCSAPSFETASFVSSF